MTGLPDNIVELARQRAVGAEIPEKGSGSGKTLDEILHDHWQEHLDSMFKVSYAEHPIMGSAVEEFCRATDFTAGRYGKIPCTNHATHKLGEEGGNPLAHNLTAYVCCEHFRAVMGRCTPNG